MQEVVFVKVSDTSSDFTGHPLQLQQLSVSEHPILLRQVAPQIPLQTHTHREENKHSCISPQKSNINNHIIQKNYHFITATGRLNATCSDGHTGAVDSPVPVSSALLTADV